jgi:Lrp/AsnC family transcriptional regulator, leucine-responsive regulatory protein
LPISLDDIDRKLLNLLQQDNRLSAEVLADKVGSSRSSVQRRIQRLRNEGAFEADIAVLSSACVGDKLLCIVDVKLENVRSDLREEFVASMRKLDAVQQCYFISGQVDFIVIISAQNMQEYDAIAKKHFADNPNVYRYHSNIVSERVKVGLQIPLK